MVMGWLWLDGLQDVLDMRDVIPLVGSGRGVTACRSLAPSAAVTRELQSLSVGR